MKINNIKTKKLGHLGLVAGMCKELNISEIVGKSDEICISTKGFIKKADKSKN